MTPNIVSIIGKSNSGKTTLLEKLVADLTRKGYAIGTVKHAHHGLDIDKKGKDSWRHRNAGAKATLVISDSQITLIRDENSPAREAITRYLEDMDLILVEGFKKMKVNKIEVFRTDGPHDHPLDLEDDHLVAFVSDAEYACNVPTFGLDEIESISAFLEKNYIHH